MKMSDSSSYSNTSDLDDIHDIDLLMQVINPDQQVQVAGANNDLTVLNHSLLFDDLLEVCHTPKSDSSGAVTIGVRRHSTTKK
ncbi:hypothetical protein Tco_0327328 [Tanacetum coccineum]